jgi:hypothetical protein
MSCSGTKRQGRSRPKNVAPSRSASASNWSSRVGLMNSRLLALVHLQTSKVWMSLRSKTAGAARARRQYRQRPPRTARMRRSACRQVRWPDSAPATDRLVRKGLDEVGGQETDRMQCCALGDQPDLSGPVLHQEIPLGTVLTLVVA